MEFLNGNSRRQKRSWLYKHCRWLLWISFSIYFFTSYLISNRSCFRPTSLITTHISNYKSRHSSRAIFEPSNATFLQRSKENRGSMKNMMIYVYNLPTNYNIDWLSNQRCSNHLFAAEVAIHRALLTSDVRTFDPYQADFFFVPVYVSCNFSTVNGFPAIGHARSLLFSAVKLISEEYPFWNRSGGSDHVFVASHDYGACFHAMEDMAIADGIPHFLKRSIILQTFGVQYKHPCQDVENVVIPPYIPPETIEQTLTKFPVMYRRDIWVYFRGKMEVHPKNIRGRFYSKQVRTVIWRKFYSDRRFHLRRHRFAGYQSEMARSVFCLCPLGWAPWSPRLVESVALGCVPVIIADGIRLPFATVVPWPEISLSVAEKDVDKLATILEDVAVTNLTRIQRKLWDPSTKRALFYNNEVREGDASWQVLSSLAHKARYVPQKSK